jgi:hypothetical protein
MVQETGWAPGLVWTCAKNLAPTGIQSPDRPARSRSLYRLGYPAHISDPCNKQIKLCLVKHSIYNQYSLQSEDGHSSESPTKNTHLPRLPNGLTVPALTFVCLQKQHQLLLDQLHHFRVCVYCGGRSHAVRSSWSSSLHCCLVARLGTVTIYKRG